MKIRIFDEELECAKAVKGEDYIKAFDENNNEICTVGGINDFKDIELIDGEWYLPETPEKQETVEQMQERINILEGCVMELAELLGQIVGGEEDEEVQ